MARNDLPTGTVTFLFTDVEGSTKLLLDIGEARYSEALAEHRRVLRQAFEAHGGVEVDTQGDAFFYAFPDAREAVAAAAEAQKSLASGPIRVRMGMHTGEPVLTDEGYVGLDVHRGARIAAAGHGGQVLLSKTTWELVDVEVTDLGEHRVKDFSEPVWILQLGSERFPPLKTISNTNLPRPASSFVGREKEVEEVTSVLRDGARLLTLTGPGGSGKTRLSIEAATELVPNFKNGVFWVGLAPLRDSALVVDTVAQMVGAKDGLAEHIAGREMLLVLDNFEQVVEAAPELAKLLEACPNLRLLVTSRERLSVRGEVQYPVPPLSDPEAVELFCQRSRLEADETIAELCRRLDDLPLAVELAAARTTVLTPQQILDRISKRLDLLRGGRDAEGRQRTLRATIEWSYELLAKEEQELFAKLSVFAGGCTLESAEQVADADLDIVQSLVDKSLLRHTDERFWMLETIREYALERLEESGQAEELRRRHAEHFLALAEAAEAHFRDENLLSGGKDWLDSADRELDNFRAAIDHFLTASDREAAQGLAGALAEFWCGRQHVPEGGRYLEAALRLDGESSTARAKALLGAAHMAHDLGDLSTARSRCEAAEALYEDLGDAWSSAHAVLWLGRVAAAEKMFNEGRQRFEASARAFSKVGDANYSLFAKRLLAWMFNELGDRERARALHEQNLAQARAQHARAIEATTLGALASYAVDEGRTEDAFALATASLRADSELGARDGIAQQLCRCAGAHALAGRMATAAQLIACSEALFEEWGQAFPKWIADENEETLARIREQLDDETFAEAWEKGRKLTIEEAVALALGDGDVHGR